MDDSFTRFLKRKYHISVFIAFIAIGILGGVALSLLAIVHIFYSPSWLVVAIVFLVVVCWQKELWLVPIAVFAGILFGIQRAIPDQQVALEWQKLVGQTVTLSGEINEDVSIGKRADQQLKISNVVVEDKTMGGIVWVSTANKLPLKRGFDVELNIQIREGFGNFSASGYRAEIVEAKDTHHDRAREIRDWFAGAVRRVIPAPEADLGIGYLVGQRSSLSDHLEEWMRVVGLTHVVVASGYNLTILVRFARRAFARVSKYLATLSASLMIGGFILITGFSPSMSRAGLVAGLSLVAWYYGRKFHPFILLSLAGAVTVLINPSFMWGDLGWYLSFAAFGGVMIIAPLLQSFFFGDKKPGTIRQIIGETVSAQIVTMPIIAFSFGTVSLFALPANLLVLPLVPLAMLLVFFAGITSIVFAAAPIFGALAYWLLTYMTTVVKYIALLPGSQLEVNFGLPLLVLSYTAIVVLTIGLLLKTKHNFLNDNLVE